MENEQKRTSAGRRGWTCCLGSDKNFRGEGTRPPPSLWLPHCLDEAEPGSLHLPVWYFLTPNTLFRYQLSNTSCKLKSVQTLTSRVREAPTVKAWTLKPASCKRGAQAVLTSAWLTTKSGLPLPLPQVQTFVRTAHRAKENALLMIPAYYKEYNSGAAAWRRWPGLGLGKGKGLPHTHPGGHLPISSTAHHPQAQTP